MFEENVVKRRNTVHSPIQRQSERLQNDLSLISKPAHVQMLAKYKNASLNASQTETYCDKGTFQPKYQFQIQRFPGGVN